MNRRSALTPKTIVDKNGRSTTVWVRAGGALSGAGLALAPPAPGGTGEDGARYEGLGAEQAAIFAACATPEPRAHELVALGLNLSAHRAIVKSARSHGAQLAFTDHDTEHGHVAAMTQYFTDTFAALALELGEDFERGAVTDFLAEQVAVAARTTTRRSGALLGPEPVKTYRRWAAGRGEDLGTGSAAGEAVLSQALSTLTDAESGSVADRLAEFGRALGEMDAAGLQVQPEGEVHDGLYARIAAAVGVDLADPSTQMLSYGGDPANNPERFATFCDRRGLERGQVSLARWRRQAVLHGADAYLNKEDGLASFKLPHGVDA